MGYDKVTFRQLRITGFFLIFPAVFTVCVYIMANYSGTNDILSLFLMGLYALIYVVLLHLVLRKAVANEENDSDISGKKCRKIAVSLIYVIRYGIRCVILLYLFVLCCKVLMLQDMSRELIAGAVLLAICYMVGKGLRGYIGFAEVSIAGFLLCLGLFAVCGFVHADFSRLTEFATLQVDATVCYTISTIMTKGYLLLLGFAMLEFVMIFYLKIRKRTRGMLVATVTVPFAVGLIGACFVIALLGSSFKSNGEKSILNVVGAMMFPGHANARLALLACYGVVLCGILLMTVHVLFICRFIKELSKDWKKSHEKKDKMPSFRMRVVVCILIFASYLLINFIFDRYSAGRWILFYLAAVDLPLSVLVPAFACRKRVNPRKLSRMAAEILGACLLACLLGGCRDRQVEEVDYLRVVMIRSADVGYEFELVSDSLEGAESANDSREEAVKVHAESLKQACAQYDATHDRSLDLSHVEYIVVDSVNVLDALYPELMEQFVTNYIEVICTDAPSLWNASEHIRAKIKAHYKGDCLAAYEPE